MLALWLGIPEDREINTAQEKKGDDTVNKLISGLHYILSNCTGWSEYQPAITVFTHSYSSDMAEVLKENRGKTKETRDI